MTGNYLDRRALTAALLAKRDGALIVAGLGSPTWDCFAAGDSDGYLYSWGGMGLALPTALGVALARPSRRVCCITGDGELMMGIGALAVVGTERPANLSVLVLDNEHFGETGRQPGLSRSLDLAAMAAASGIGAIMRVARMDQVDELARFLFRDTGPAFAVAKIALGDHPLLLPEKDGAIIARRFRDAAAG
jgi:phosphonopyruvate decarboxylase